MRVVNNENVSGKEDNMNQYTKRHSLLSLYKCKFRQTVLHILCESESISDGTTVACVDIVMNHASADLTSISDNWGR